MFDVLVFGHWKLVILDFDYPPAIASPRRRVGCSLDVGAWWLELFHAPLKNTRTYAYKGIFIRIPISNTFNPSHFEPKTPLPAPPRTNRSDFEIKKIFSMCIEMYSGVFKRSIAR
jgi:hypothetical protein